MAALPLDLIDLALAVVLATGLKCHQLRVPREHLESGQHLSHCHTLSVAARALLVAPTSLTLELDSWVVRCLWQTNDSDVIQLTGGWPVAETRTAISLFSGCGGLDLGVEEAGFRVAAAVEIDADAADTMEKNFANLRRPVIRRDIRTVTGEELLEAAGLASGEGPDLLVGGPPCIAFSKSGFWLDYKRDGVA